MANDRTMKMIRARTFHVAQIALAVALACAEHALCQPVIDPLAEARSLLAAGQLEQSEKWLHTYLGNNPSSADAHFLLGYVLFREKKPKDSLAEFTAGAAARRPKVDELKTVASDYVLLGDYEDADHWFSEITSESPNDAETWYLLGRTKYNEGRFEEGVSSFERSLALHPRDVEAEDNLGLCRKELNQLKEAKVAFQTAIEWQGKTPTDAQPFLNLGILIADAGEWENAIRYLTQAASLSPSNPRIHEELGAVYQEQNELPKAQEELERAVTLAPKSSEAHFKLAELYRKEGKRDRAQQEFEICSQLNSTHSSSQTPNPFLPNPNAPPKP
jgi:tetratricopeptide (TPR) repeat protein